MLLLVLGLIDIVAGITLVNGLLGATVIAVLGAVMLLKGLFSLVSNIASGHYADFLGILDVLAGAALLLAWSVPVLWLFVIAKGFWSVMMSLAS